MGLPLLNSVAITGSPNIALVDDLPPKIGQNPPNCIILDSWTFDNFILADKLFGKALETSKLVYQLTIIYVEN